MTPSNPTVDSTYRSFAELLLRRHRLLADETSDSTEIDALEDRMTALWEKLDESQRQSLNGLGSDLNWARRRGAAAPKARKAEEVSDTDRANLAAAEAAQDPHATLHWLRVCSPAMELKDLAQRRRRAYTWAGLPQVADVVGEALEKRTPTHPTGGTNGTSEPLLIVLEIPFLGWDGQPDSIAFHHWLPLQDHDSIRISDRDRSLSLRITPDCTHYSEMCSPENLSKWGNVSIEKIIAEVCLLNVSAELINGIVAPDHSNKTQEWLYHNPHRVFAIEIVNWVLGYVNRLVSYAAYQKGQYNLAEFSLDAENLHTALIRFKAKVKVGDSEWMRWNPPGIGGVWRGNGYPREREIRAEDWPKIKQYVTSTGKPPLVRELLARADSLKERGHERAALTEAVTALEVAIHKFARQPNAQMAFGSILASRMDVASLPDQVKHAGLSCSVRYLLPILFSEETIPTEVLRGCADAISQRQNVVHTGQRTVDATKLTTFLKSIRTLCELLEKYEAENVPG